MNERSKIYRSAEQVATLCPIELDLISCISSACTYYFGLEITPIY